MPERDLFANFERTGLRGRGFAPPVDVYYVDGPPRALVRVELAGVTIDDVALEIRGRQLLIAGERRPEQAQGRLYQQIEIEHGPFRRVVELGADVVAERARATYEEGMLVVEVPLAQAEDQVKRIDIRGGHG